MPDFITLTCPTCGGKLQITENISIFVCGHCGNEHIVHREGGAIYLAPLAHDVRQMRVGVDKTASELALVRLQKEIDDLEARRNALLKRPRQPERQPHTQQKDDGTDKGCTITFIGIGLCIVLFWLVALWSTGQFILFTFAAVLEVFLATVIVLTIREKPEKKPIPPADKTSADKTSLQLEIDGITAELKAKRIQLQRNQQIVNG